MTKPGDKQPKKTLNPFSLAPYRATWPGGTWIRFYLNPVPLRYQLGIMSEVPLDVAASYREKRNQSALN